MHLQQSWCKTTTPAGGDICDALLLLSKGKGHRLVFKTESKHDSNKTTRTKLSPVNEIGDIVWRERAAANAPAAGAARVNTGDRTRAETYTRASGSQGRTSTRVTRFAHGRPRAYFDRSIYSPRMCVYALGARAAAPNTPLALLHKCSSRRDEHTRSQRPSRAETHAGGRTRNHASAGNACARTLERRPSGLRHCSALRKGRKS